MFHFGSDTAALSATMLHCARPFRPYRNVFLTWARPRLLYSPGGRPSRIGQPLAVEGSEGGCYIHPQPLVDGGGGRRKFRRKRMGEEEVRRKRRRIMNFRKSHMNEFRSLKMFRRKSHLRFLAGLTVRVGGLP